MKPSLIIGAILLCLPFTSFSQSAFLDAQDFLDYIEFDEESGTYQLEAVATVEFFDMIRSYNPEYQDYSDEELLGKVNNPFFGLSSEYIKFSPPEPEEIDPSDFDEGEILSYAIEEAGTGGVGIFSGGGVTMFADGLAKFLIQRTKQELTVSFFRQFQRFLRDYPEAAMLFPTTTDILTRFEAYEFNVFIQFLRESYYIDLEGIPNNLLNFTNLNPDYCPDGNVACMNRLSKYQDFWTTESGMTFWAVGSLANGFIDGQHPAELINSVASDPKWAISNSFVVQNSMKMANLLSQSFAGNDFERFWIERDEVGDLQRQEMVYLFLGLIYEQNKSLNIQYGRESDQSLANLLQVMGKNPSGVYQFADNLLKDIDLVENQVERLRNAWEDNEDVDLRDYLAYVRQTGDVIRSLTMETSLSNFVPSFTWSPKVDLYLDLVDSGLGIFYDLQAQNYNSLVLNMYTILERTLSAEQFPSAFQDGLMKYGIFIAALALANNSNDVQAAIQAIALPVGSASIKKRSSFNVALNAYLGGFVGGEYLTVPDPVTLEKSRSDALLTAVHAPVGITVSRGFGPVHRSSSLSLFVPIIDIGAFAAFRINDPFTESLPEIDFKNLFAPGAYLVYGFPNAPFSIGAGGQLGPFLREFTISSGGLGTRVYTNYRLGVNFAVDIPIMNLSTKPRR